MFHCYLPVTFHPDYYHPIVDITINGKHFKAYLDSGALFDASMPKEHLEKIGAVVTEKEWESVSLTGEKFRAKEYKAQSQFATCLPENIHLMEYHEWAHCIGDYPPDSLNLSHTYVGLGLLKRYNVYLNFPDHNIMLFSNDQSEPPEKAQWSAWPFFLTNVGVEFLLFQQSNPIRAILDTAASHSALLIEAEKMVLQKIEASENKEERMPNLRMGEFAFDLNVIRMLKAENVLSADLILGCNFLKDHPVFIDFKNNLMWMKK